ncbi:MAG: hypothetical protein J0H63_06140, partial [Rhizobiales bacterium]|nr:hypothetical protein [Hyphomicrobiales bacterium]
MEWWPGFRRWRHRRRNAWLDASDPGLFRFGFLAHPSSAPPDGDDVWKTLDGSWRTTRLGPLTIRFHPETEMALHRTADGSEIAIIGRLIFATPQLAPPAIADLAADAPAALRNATGRFAVIVCKGGAVSVFHDAFGARSIFYRGDPRAPAFASHSGLLAHAYGIPLAEAPLRIVASREYTKQVVRTLPGDLTMFEDVF